MYLAYPGGQCPVGPIAEVMPLTRDLLLDTFIANLRYVRTFITNARYDPVVYAPAIPYLVKQQGFGGNVDSAARPGVARPGWFTVDLPLRTSANPEPAKTVEVRFPSYTNSGHVVAVQQPGDLASDVEAWWAGAP